jgi:hypothetical protein
MITCCFILSILKIYKFILKFAYLFYIYSFFSFTNQKQPKRLCNYIAYNLSPTTHRLATPAHWSHKMTNLTWQPGTYIEAISPYYINPTLLGFKPRLTKNKSYQDFHSQILNSQDGYLQFLWIDTCSNSKVDLTRWKVTGILVPS